ncbi:DUF6701 domain-containing protein [Caminibacter sp.]
MKKFLYFLLLCVSIAYSATIYETEPNNKRNDSGIKTITSVNDVGVGHLKSNKPNRDRVDWWKFKAPESGLLNIYTTGYNSRLSIKIYKNNKLITSKNNMKNNVNISFYAKSGIVYYIKLYANRGDSDYELHFRYLNNSINITYNQRDFSLRKKYNIRGNFSIIGNTVLCYKNWNGKCIDISNPNNDTQLSYINLLGNGYINSSKAEITNIPDNAKILWVGFYTQGDTKKSKNELISRLLNNPSYLVKPDKYKIAIYPQQIDIYHFGDVNTFATFSEVKQLESNSTHTVYGKDIKGWWYGANIQTDEGLDRDLGFYGAWTMVVVYQDSNMHLKNISIFDGYKYVFTNSNDVKIKVSGFLTPKYGKVNSKVSVFVGEGDLAYKGDTISMKTENSDYINLNINTPYEYNAFYSGINNVVREPDLTNNFGIDIHTYNVGTDGLKIIKNGDTSATLKFHSEGDAYFPNLFVFSTDLYEPRVCYYIDKITDNSGDVYYKDGNFVKDIDPSKEYNVSLWIANMKKNPNDRNIETADKVKIFVDYNNTEYINNSTFIKNIGWDNFRHITDANDSDIGVYVSELNESVWNVGKDSNSTSGGIIEPATSFNDDLHKVFAHIDVKFNVENNSSFNLDNYLIFKATLRIPTINVNINNAYKIPKCVDFNTTAQVQEASIGAFDVVNKNFTGNKDPLTKSSLNSLNTQITNKVFELKLIHLGDDNQTLTKTTAVALIQLIKFDKNTVKTKEDCLNAPGFEHYIGVFMFNNDQLDFYDQIPFADKKLGYRIFYYTGPVCSNSSSITGFVSCIINAWPQKFNACSYSCGRMTQEEAMNGNSYGYSYANRHRWRNQCMKCIFDVLRENSGKVNYVCSRDNFAVRPYKYEITNILPSYKAGDDINLTIKAVDFNGNPTLDYNETLNIRGNSPDIAYNETKSGCRTGTLTGSNLRFTNGIAHITLHYNEVGDLNLTIKEVNGSEFANVDSDDTPWNQRVIEENSTVLHILPYKFDVTGNYGNFNGGAFTYMSNDLNMSSVLNLTIRAVNKNNGTTQNYNKNCYAQNLDINISHTIPLDSNIQNILYKEENETSEHNISKSSLIIFNNLSKNYFTTDHNGSAVLKVEINFPKNYRLPVNEFNLTVNDVNVSDVNGTFGNKSLNQSTTFRYGSVFVNNISGYDSNELNLSTKYMYFKNNTWVQNIDHNSSVFGEINLTKTYKPSNITITVLPQSTKNIYEGIEKFKISTTHVLPYSAKIHFSIPSWLWYHPLALNYKDPSPTNLNCLTHPCIKVTFLKSGKGWAGVGRNTGKYTEKNITVETNVSIETNVSKQGVKKLNW